MAKREGMKIEKPRYLQNPLADFHDIFHNFSKKTANVFVHFATSCTN